MNLYIKNMVCSSCKMVVKAQLENKGLRPLFSNLIEVEEELPYMPKQTPVKLLLEKTTKFTKYGKQRLF